MCRGLLIAACWVLLPMGMLYPLWSCPTAAGEDDAVYYGPLRQMVADQLRSGRWPTWNPAEAAGVPLAADPQCGLTFPTTWLFWLLPHRLAFSGNIFLAFALAGGGAWLYLRRIGLRAPAAGLGALAFAFSGYMVAHRVHLSFIQAAAVLPWGLWAIEGLRRSAAGAFAWVAPAFVAVLAAGHWPSAIHIFLVWFAYLLLRGRPIGRAIAAAGAAAVVGLVFLSPQIAATGALLGGSVRSDIPYAVATENSFNPLCAVLAFLPFIMGLRTPNFFGQPWWGPNHLCEMLGYVGLVTLALAAGAVWRMYRSRPAPAGGGAPDAAPPAGPAPPDLAPLVRVWTWLLVGAGIWALGCFLPTYRLIHRIPVLGVVRCPARMLLTVDLALATLAALAVHSLMTAPPPGLRRTVRRWTLIYLPLCIAASLALLWGLAVGAEKGCWPIGLMLSGPVKAMREAVSPASPAVYVPVALAALTVPVVGWFLAAPARRSAALTVLVGLDLLLVARFVDVPPADCPCPAPAASPAASWLRAHAPADAPYRVWGLSRSYHRRAAELLLPKACAAMGFETISYYGPFQPADHARLFGFRSWGTNEHWESLIRRNHLLSLYNVRYVLAAGEEFRQAIESVRIPAGPPPADGPDLLGDGWTLRHARRRGEVLTLQAPGLWRPARARQRVALEGGEVYRVGLDVRAPRGAGNLILIRYVPEPSRPESWQGPALRIDLEQVTGRWRHFEATFRPSRPRSRPFLEVLTLSERPVEVRNVRLRRSTGDRPIFPAGRLGAGERVYADRTPEGLPPLRQGEPRVHVYENRLCLPRSFPVRQAVFFDSSEQVIEALRWPAGRYDLTRQVLLPKSGGSFRGGRFVSEDLALRRPGACRSANGLGAVVAGAVEEGGPSAGAVALAVAGPSAGLALYLIGLIWLRRMNRKR